MAARPTGDDQAARLGLAVVGLYLAGVAVFALVAPGSFFEVIGPFGTRNDHYTRDAGTFQLALGIAALAAVPRSTWHAPLLALLALQFALHAISHLIDIDDADPRWLGPAEAIGLSLSALALAYLSVRARRGRGAR